MLRIARILKSIIRDLCIQGIHFNKFTFIVSLNLVRSKFKFRIHLMKKEKLRPRCWEMLPSWISSYPEAIFLTWVLAL